MHFLVTCLTFSRVFILGRGKPPWLLVNPHLHTLTNPIFWNHHGCLFLSGSGTDVWGERGKYLHGSCGQLLPILWDNLHWEDVDGGSWRARPAHVHIWHLTPLHALPSTMLILLFCQHSFPCQPNHTSLVFHVSDIWWIIEYFTVWEICILSLFHFQIFLAFWTSVLLC